MNLITPKEKLDFLKECYEHLRRISSTSSGMVIYQMNDSDEKLDDDLPKTVKITREYHPNIITIDGIDKDPMSVNCSKLLMLRMIYNMLANEINNDQPLDLNDLFKL